MPLASGAYPTHYNEKGIRVDGFLSHEENWGLNYVMSLGNGYDAWDISGYKSWDMNENKTFNCKFSFKDLSSYFPSICKLSLLSFPITGIFFSAEKAFK